MFIFETDDRTGFEVFDPNGKRIGGTYKTKLEACEAIEKTYGVKVKREPDEPRPAVWWRVQKAKMALPEPIVIDRVEGETVYFANGFKRPLIGGTSYFPSRKEAKLFILERAKRRVETKIAELSEAQLIFEAALKIPDEAES